jgi:hypothetical protein
VAKAVDSIILKHSVVWHPLKIWCHCKNQVPDSGIPQLKFHAGCGSDDYQKRSIQPRVLKSRFKLNGFLLNFLIVPAVLPGFTNLKTDSQIYCTVLQGPVF